jgi:ATP-dependent RNA helicase DDX49/DBP8
MDSFTLFKRKRQPDTVELRKKKPNSNELSSKDSFPPIKNTTNEQQLNSASSFPELGISPWLTSSCSSMKVIKPTLVQSSCIPSILQGRDVIACSQTGSGKTVAFAIPILEKLSQDPYGIYAVVLTASRELAYQISEQFIVLGAPIGIRVCTIVGGMDMVKQALSLNQRPHIVVATPGRLAHHLSTGSSPPDLSRAAFLVLDEADRVLEPSMADDVNVILRAMNCSPNDSGNKPRKAQILLFSATISSQVGQVAQLGMKNPLVFDASSIAATALADGSEKYSELTVSTLNQQYIFVSSTVKYAYVIHVLFLLMGEDLQVQGPNIRSDGSGGDLVSKKKKKTMTRSAKSLSVGDDDDTDFVLARSVILFTSSCKAAALLTELLKELGIPCVGLHSALPQRERFASLGKFKSSLVRVLVATDVASRGLDIPEVDLVINVDVPQMPSDYVHRVGRTARAGRGGRAVTIITQYDIELIQAIESEVLGGKKLELLPNIDENLVLLRLAKVASALKLAKSRVNESGLDETLALRKARRFT